MRWKYCLKRVRIKSYCCPRFPALGMNMERYSASLHIKSKSGKMRTIIAPHTDSFQEMKEK